MAVPSTVLASRLLVRARLRHLQVLVKTGELGSVQRAAAAVGLTQPSTSHVLADLERLLGCALFHRHARGVTPTRVAQALLPLARKILDTVNDCADVASALSGSASSVVRVVAITGAVSGVLSKVLPVFSRDHPDVLVQVQEMDIEQIGALLATGDVDLVLCRRRAEIPQGWRFDVLLDDRFAVVCGPQHPLARKRRLRMERLWDQTWLHGALASAPRRAFDDMIAQSGKEPPLRLISTRSLSLMWSMLQAQELLSLVPLSVARQLLDAGELVQLDVEVPVPFEAIGVLSRETDVGEATQLLRSSLCSAREGLVQKLNTQGRKGEPSAP